MATALRARPLSVGRSCVLPRDRSVAHRATAIDANWSTRTEGNAPCAERRATRRAEWPTGLHRGRYIRRRVYRSRLLLPNSPIRPMMIKYSATI